MAERDMTGDERPERLGLPGDLAGPDPAAPDPAEGLARRRADDPPRIGRLGFDGFAADLAGLAGGRGDLANLPPWSVRDDSTGERPDRDPVALAAWRRVAERRRLRAGVEPVAAGMEVVDDIPAADVPDVVRAEVVADLADDRADDRVDDRAERSAWTEGTGHHMAGDRAEVPVDEDAVDLVEPTAEVDHDDAEPADGFVNEIRPDEVPPAEPPADLLADEVDEPAAPAVSTSEGRPEGGPPPARGPGAPAARGGRDPRPGTPPTARPDQGGRHEVLLSLAGRIDDDALSSVRELVAVEDDAAAAELLGGCLLAAGAGVTAREHAVLGRWFAASRVDPELIDVLPRDPEADRREEHRFTPDPPASARASGSSRDAGEAVARAAGRLPGVQRVRQCWRTTPAGSAPGPVPHRVVLVETHSADDCEHVAHHVAHAARELGAVSVEVFAAGAELPAYHRAAVRVARPLGPAAPTASSSVSETAPLGPPVGAPRPTPGPSPRRTDDEVPPFGVPVSAPSAGPPSFLTVTGPDDADELRPAEPAPEERSGDQQYRIVAAAGPDPLERESARERDVTEPAALPESETVAPEEPAPVDLDPETTAERIAALWRTPPPDEILSDEHPLSSWAETSLGTGFGPGPEDAVTDAGSSAIAGPAPSGPSVDPDAATGEFPAVSGPATPATGVDVPATNGVDLPGANGEARVRRARHSRSETGEFEAPVVDAPASPVRTNGHHHGSERPDASGDAVTGPVQRPADASGTAPTPSPPTPAPAGSSGPDSVDSQLSDRERELLARLHEELASRERPEADAPDPLTGRPVAPPAGSEDTTAPRPRPTGPHPGPGRPPGPPPGPPGGTNGHRPVNGHGLPRRRDHDGEDGASPGA